MNTKDGETMTGWDQAELDEVRTSVRAVVDHWVGTGLQPSCDSWLRAYDLDFSRAMARQGLIGVSWPREFGGGGRSGLARLVVTEELLRTGAPVAAHWIADRQIGPSILRYGSDSAKAKYLHGIAAAEITFCLGMSETEAGSDLAAVSTVARRCEGGWSITGRKIWTSNAHRSTHAYVLARTSRTESRHQGLTEFLVDLDDPGVTVRPLYDLTGAHHFNEMILESVVVKDEDVLGEVGGGWQQVTNQLALERGGIERVLSTYPLLSEAVRSTRNSPLESGTAEQIGLMFARLAALRAMAFDVALQVQGGGSPTYQAAMLKDLGTVFECDAIEVSRRILDIEPDLEASDGAGLLAHSILAAPGFTIRGGTTEILRGIIAQGGGPSNAGGSSDFGRLVQQVLGNRGGEPSHELDDVWGVLVDLGWPFVGVPEDDGGDGGDMGDVATLVEGLARNNVSIPLTETIVARRLLAASGVRLDEQLRVTTLAIPTTADHVSATRDQSGAWCLSGSVRRVPWGILAEAVLVVARESGGEEMVFVVDADHDGVRWTPGQNVAGEPRDHMVLECVQVAEPITTNAHIAQQALSEISLLRATAMVGALDAALTHTRSYVSTREQFGRPLLKFQAVAHSVAVFASNVECARAAVEQAVAAVIAEADDRDLRVAAARVVAGRAADEGTRIAHQLHAAMGTTREYPLHLSTRRLWSWRDELGTQRSWAEALGRALAVRDEEAIWRWVTNQGCPTDALEIDGDPACTLS
jgi:alkylation response protein AidB-like acyl-CoA dehydrogenase